MKRRRIKTGLFPISIAALILVSISWVSLIFEADELIEYIPFNKEIKSFLIKRLVKVVPLASFPCESDTQSEDIIYILGGSQEALRYRIETAAELYHHGIGKEVLILSRPGVTEYDPAVKRNLTNDEWATKRLVTSGVRKEDIELISLAESFFGTFAEGRKVSALVLKRDYKHLK